MYGLEVWATSVPSLLREAVWCGFIALIFLLHIKHWKSYRKKWGKSWIAFGGLVVFSVLISYFLHHKGVGDLFIGIKYGFWWLFVLLSATSVGFFYHKKCSSLSVVHWLKWGLLVVVVVGFVWQGLKLGMPEIFAHMGYELKLDDFHFGEKPPIYYLTGYEGTLRWQGLFAGPNNYGYFLVAFFPLMLLFFGESLKKLKSLTIFQWVNIGILVLWMVAMVMTLSRAVILGGMLVVVLVNWSFLKQKKKLLLRGGVACVGVLVLLSFMKRESTLGHLSSKL